MIVRLRQRHQRMWIILTPLLVAGVIIAYWKAPRFPPDSYGSSSIHFPELTQSIVSNNYMVNLKKNYSGGTAIEILQISDINPVSELVSIEYVKKGKKERTSEQLGMMGSNTNYFFNLGTLTPPFKVIIRDTLKQQTLAEVDF